jgi:hypothetical protein
MMEKEWATGLWFMDKTTGLCHKMKSKASQNVGQNPMAAK